ncbi:MAG: Lrp/AsnC family transcriptional regulator [Coriobacteriia bacterium]|nr:Lrp/AsnC family transcriptional regulator [Coriobacteriia bacterium]
MKVILDLDATDRAILAALQEDARIRHAELGRAVGLTAPAVAARIRRLEHAGIITGYHAQIDLKKAGYGLVAFVRISSAVELSGQLNSLVAGMPEILEFHHVTGTEGFVLKVAVRSVEHLEHVIGKLLPFGQTITSIVLSSPVTWRAIEFDVKR